MDSSPIIRDTTIDAVKALYTQASPVYLETGQDKVETLGRVLGRPAFLPAPAFAIKWLVGDFADVLLASQCVLPARAQAAGYAVRYATLEPALRACLER